MGLFGQIRCISPIRKSRPNSPTSNVEGNKEGAGSPKQVTDAIIHKKQFATEGNLNFRLLAFAGGVAVIFTSIESLSICIFERDFLKIFIYIYTLCFGWVICILEGQFIKLDMVKAARQEMVDKIPILKYLWGRGAFYVVSGILQLSELSPANILSGLFLVGVGALFVAIGWSTKKRLSKLKKCLKDPKKLKKIFRQYDKDGDEVLDRDEFGALIVGITAEEMDEDELEGTFAVLDTSGKGYVTLEELTKWFLGFDASAKEEETGGYDLM
jgi:hypothetical protein